MKKKLCIVDMVFGWPPDGGAPVDLYNLIQQFKNDYDVFFIIPRLSYFHKWLQCPWPLNRTKFFSRGQIDDCLLSEIHVQVVDIGFFEFTPKNVVELVYKKIKSIDPDFVFIADSWFYKPYLTYGLSTFKPVVRLYAHEGLCIKGNGLLFKNNQLCSTDYLKDNKTQKECVKCASSYLLKYPSPRWVTEFIYSKAYSRFFQQNVIEAYNRAKLIVVGNNFIKEKLKKFIKAPVINLPHPIKIIQFETAFKARIPSRIVRFLFAGRVDFETKGGNILIQAAQLLYNRKMRFEIMVTSHNKRLKKYPFIKPLGWFNHNEIEKLYSKADVTIVPSIWPDPFPIVTLESFASAMPVIGSKIGGIQEQIDHGINGFLFEAGNSKDLSECMAKFIDNPSLIQHMSLKALEKARSQYEEKYVYENYYKPIFS